MDTASTPPIAAEAGGRLPEARRLDVLAKAVPAALKEVAEGLLAGGEEIEVIASRTGLVLLPRRDSVTGTPFHLGEVMVAEAHVRFGGTEGYGAIVGRDLERAMAMAVIDAAIAGDRADPAVHAFLAREDARQTAEDAARLRQVEATRVEMEAF